MQRSGALLATADRTKHVGLQCNWSQPVPGYPLAKLHQVLKHTFQIPQFRDRQLEVINATLGQKDVFVVMPAGAGKSLTYQLPALLNKGVTLVVSPLISLLEDQVQQLQAVGISSCSITSMLSKDDARACLSGLEQNVYKLVYVTPERLVKSKTLMSKLEKLSAQGLLERVVIDEAHCVSQWG